MAWTWVADDFNRSDRLLDGDPVGASALTWQHWNANATEANAPRIISNVPTTAGTNYNVQWLATDVAPLAGGAAILGVGVEVQFTSLGSTDGTNYFGELFAAIPAGFNGTMAWVQTGGPSSEAVLYTSTVAGTEQAAGGPSVGMIAVGRQTVERTANITSTSSQNSNITWAAGDTVRLEAVFGAWVTVFYNGTGIFQFPSPASITGNTMVAGNLFRSYWNHDNWRVGVLT